MFSGGYSPFSAYPEPQFQPAQPERPQRPTYYDLQPPPQVQQQIYPREAQYYRSSNLPSAQPFRDPPARKVQVLYYDPNDPNFRPPGQSRAPFPAPVALPPPQASYIEIPSSSSQFRVGDNFTVMAVEENSYRSVRPRVNYDYPGGYNDYQGGYRGGHYPY